ncbi:uncharacterized protein LOC101165054 isoform X3 [Oryzias latipes]|uniref:uncharacterized protein LOC101165054 isoform X3 n=1 Tax=Oryzias latipes TaxID=8090 RepID=UPI0005CC5407|nr:uncharacterized protein LOC101165054 isoform X3 [Oryzias latipes]
MNSSPHLLFRVWISCLLLGSISCSPPQGDLSEEPSSVSDRSNRQRLLQSSNMGGARDPGFRAHDFIPEFFQFWDPEIIEAASAGSSSPHQSAEESWSHAPDQEEPFFTDMNGHDPVFTLDSHSNYLRKRNIATKASFTPRGLNPKKRPWTSS